MPLYQPPLEINWDAIGGKPATFPPDAHSHEWSAIAGKPATFPPDIHNHGIITSSSVPAGPYKGLIWNELDTNANFLMEWVWDGSRWRSKQILIFGSGIQTNGGSPLYYRLPINPLQIRYNLYLVKATGSFKLTGVNNSTNYWNIHFSWEGNNLSVNTISILKSDQLIQTSGVKELIVESNLNTLIDTTSAVRLYLYIYPTNSPTSGAGVFAGSLSYQWARP